MRETQYFTFCPPAFRLSFAFFHLVFHGKHADRIVIGMPVEISIQILVFAIEYVYITDIPGGTFQ